VIVDARSYAGDKALKGLEVAVVANWQFSCLLRSYLPVYIRTVRLQPRCFTIDRYTLGVRTDSQRRVHAHCCIYCDVDVFCD
jgi:hypothetical protein